MEYEDGNDAARAILELNGTQLDGREIYVREDREDYELKGIKRNRRDSSPRVAGAGQQQRSGTGRRVLVTNLAPGVAWQVTSKNVLE